MGVRAQVMLPWGTFDLSLMEEVQQTKLAEAQQ